MGYVRITKPDGTEIFIGEDFDDEFVIETCDVCNDPRPSRDLINIGGLTDHDAIWQCSKCHAISGTKKEG